MSISWKNTSKIDFIDAKFIEENQTGLIIILISFLFISISMYFAMNYYFDSIKHATVAEYDEDEDESEEIIEEPTLIVQKIEPKTNDIKMIAENIYEDMKKQFSNSEFVIYKPLILSKNKIQIQIQEIKHSVSCDINFNQSNEKIKVDEIFCE